MALRNKFKNVRRVASGPAVAINRRIFGHAAMKRRKRVNTTDHPSLKRKLFSGDATSEPEDDISVAAHVKWLQKQFKKQQKDLPGIKDRMDRTFADRRQTIAQSPVSMVLDKYVFLRDARESLCEPISRICVGSKASKKILEDHEVVAGDAEAAVYAKLACTLRLIVKHFKEDEKAMFVTQTADAELPLHPCITCDGSRPLQSTEQLFKLFVDKVLLFEADDLTQAVTSLFAAYWLFGIKYNEKLWNFLSFLELHVFGLKETSPRPPVIKLMKLLQ